MANNQNGYKCRYCGSSIQYLGQCIKHQQICHKSHQYIVQAACKGFYHEAPKQYKCLLCKEGNVFERTRTISGHIKSCHKDDIFVDESGNYELKNAAFNDIFANNRHIYESFLQLTRLIQNHKGENDANEQTLFERLQRYCNEFMTNFATKADVNALQADVNAIKNAFVDQGKHNADMQYSLGIVQNRQGAIEAKLQGAIGEVQDMQGALEAKLQGVLEKFKDLGDAPTITGPPPEKLSSSNGVK